jgi:hypothetical protein
MSNYVSLEKKIKIEKIVFLLVAQVVCKSRRTHRHAASCTIVGRLIRWARWKILGLWVGGDEVQVCL